MPISAAAVPIIAGAIMGAGLGVKAYMDADAQKMKVPTKKFPDMAKLHGRRYVEQYTAEAELVSKIAGLGTFGLAASKRESGWNNMAVNDAPSEARASCLAYEYNKGKSPLKESPYISDPSYFCWGTGGWFGQMPAYVLARRPFETQNPIWAVHDPATSTAMFTATVRTLIRNHFPRLPEEHRNWLAIRRSMASLDVFYDYEETTDRAKGVRERLTENLEQIGVDPMFMYEKPTSSGYPGNQAVWDALRAIQPIVNA